MTEAVQPGRIGELVGGKYRIVRFLATGGMGVVYEAQHEVVKRRFAVKLLRADLAERRDILARFQREAEAAGALESENVTAAVDFGIARDGTPFIVMEYLVGESLATLLARTQHLPVGRAADLVAQACRGMQAAHAAGIVHRDLKPQNLFVCRREDGTDLLKVLDFGVAKLQALDELTAATRTGTVMGTVSYMSPEQARGDKVVDQRADVYALGAILYQLLSGTMPHPGDSNNAILHHISTQPAVPLDSAHAGLPPALVQVVAQALSPRPEDRPVSAEAFGQQLVPFAARQVWPAAREQTREPAPSDSAATPLAGSGAASPSPVVSSTTATAPTEAGEIRPDAGQPRTRVAAWLVVGAVLVAVAVAVAGLRGARTASTSGRSEPAPLVARPPSPPAPTPPVAAMPPVSTATTAQGASARLPAQAGGSPPVSPTHAMADQPAPRRAASSSSARGARVAHKPNPAPLPPPRAPDAAGARPAGKARIAPVTFDEQNPYN